MKILPLPPHFAAANSADPLYQANINALQVSAEAWSKAHGLKPVGADKVRISVLPIDDQSDFSFSQGTLYVGGRSGTGAPDAHTNLVNWGYKYMGIISEVIPTMDTHLPFQVFYPSAHLRKDGSHPDAGIFISADEYRHGEFMANPAMAAQLGVDPAWLTRQFTYYCSELEKPDPVTGQPKYQLFLWPYHCMLGSQGHKLVGTVDEFRLFHAFARGATNTPEIKGGNPFTESYSIFQPEVMTLFSGQPIPGVQKNTRLIERLLNSDMIVIAGLASSHCVKESIADFLKHIVAQDPQLARKVYIMRDCTAAVYIPDALGPGKPLDFTDMAEQAFQNFQDAGMNVVESCTPIEDWPGAAQILKAAA